MNGLALYFRYVSISVRSQLQYRASFIMQTLGHFLATGTEFPAIWALFSRFGNLKGWQLAEVAFFYATVHLSFAIADSLTRGFDRVAELIKTGGFDRLLLRLRSTVLQLLGHELTLRRFGRFSQALVILVAAGLSLGVAWSAGKFALLLFTVLGGVETAQYPLPIYLPWFRKFFTFVIPLACVNYFPVLPIVGKSDVLGSPPWLQKAAPLAGVLFLFIALRVWRLGLRRYSSTGS